MTYQFDIEYDVTDCTGADVVEYFISAHDPDTGLVLRHMTTFRSHDLFIDQQTGEEVLWARPSGDAETEARVLLSAIKGRGSINLQWWEEYVPAAVS